MTNAERIAARLASSSSTTTSSVRIVDSAALDAKSKSGI